MQSTSAIAIRTNAGGKCASLNGYNGGRLLCPGTGGDISVVNVNIYMLHSVTTPSASVSRIQHGGWVIPERYHCSRRTTSTKMTTTTALRRVEAPHVDVVVSIPGGHCHGNGGNDGDGGGMLSIHTHTHTLRPHSSAYMRKQTAELDNEAATAWHRHRGIGTIPRRERSCA